MSLEENAQPENGLYVLVTGANSGLGLGIGTRLIDEFLQTRPQNESLILIVTTRDQRKGDTTIEKLQKHVQVVCRKAEKSVPGVSTVLQRRIILRQERLDLLSLVSVQKLAIRLRETLPKLDVLICNAGIGGWVGMNWPRAVWTCLTDLTNATVWPTYFIAREGQTTTPQILATQVGKEVDEPPLGKVFCANFFGHYMLGHYLAPLLARHPKSEEMRGRLIWTSSITAHKDDFDINDVQGLRAKQPYESSKRLIDLLGITSRFPFTAPFVSSYLSHAEASAEETTQPRVYVAHPGVTATSIVPLPLIMEYFMILFFYMGRWLGQQWHCVSVHKAAVTMVWLTLAKQSTLDTMEEREGVAKWGSACDVGGNERVERTEVPGWGWSGRIGERRRKGRSPYATDLTKEEHDEFLVTGLKCWEEVEELREVWEKRLEEAGAGVKMD